MDFWTEIVSEKNLNKAWAKVKSQNGSPGIDGISVSSFALNADMLLAEIREELCSGTFSFSAVKICSILSGSKQREIGLCTVRDKIVQNSITAVLNAHFEPYLSPAAYAYRQGKSVNQAVHKVRDFFKQGYTFAFKGDIENFFDGIDHDILINQLEAYEVDNKTLELIRKALCTNLFRGMELINSERGTVQGSVLSPLLSNIYLMPLDQTLCSGPWKFARYSDDFVLLANSASSLEVGKRQLDIQLTRLKLKIHPQKSFNVDAQQGFDFLGFRVSMSEFLPASKSLQHLENILHEALLRGEEGKAEQEWLGWINFFGYPQLEPHTPEVFLFLLSHTRDAKDISRLKSFRAGMSVSDVEWLLRTAKEWFRLGCKEEAYLEYARFQLADSSRTEGLDALSAVFNERTAEVIDILKSVVLGQATKEQWSTLAEIYGDIGEYALAKATLSYSFDTPEKSIETTFVEQDKDSLSEGSNIDNDFGEITYDDKTKQTSQEKILDMLQDNIIPEKEYELSSNIHSNTEDQSNSLLNKLNWDFLEEDLERAVELFNGREGISALEQVDEKGFRRFTLREEPLTAADFHRHLKGEFSLGIYLIRANETVKFAVIDIDISRQVILNSPDKSTFDAYKQDALTDAKQLINVARQENLPVILEDSGNRGYGGSSVNLLAECQRMCSFV